MITPHDFNQFHISLSLGALVEATFLSRPNRFRAEVQVGRRTGSAHVANPGRLKELLTPGRTVWLRSAAHSRRKTDYDLVLASHEETLVSLDSRLPNALLGQALQSGCVPWIDVASVRAEVRLGDSRLDFLALSRDSRRWWIEAKSVTLIEDHVARFPDAPTARGRRHIAELISAVQAGAKGMVIFVVQRADALCFSPNHATDPEFGAALHSAAAAGVQIRAIRCRVTIDEISLDREIPVFLDGQLSHRYNPCHAPDKGDAAKERETR